MKDEALRLALEALKTCQIDGDGWSGPDYWFDSEKVGKAITAIKQVLEQEKALQVLHNENERLGLYKDAYGQPEPEPRVWIDHRVHAYPDCFVMQPDPPHTSPLYTSPPKRKPLTDEQIEALRRSDDLFEDAPMWRLIARAIEAAHGIKGDA